MVEVEEELVHQNDRDVGCCRDGFVKSLNWLHG